MKGQKQNNQMQILKVEETRSRKDFLDFARKLYKDDPNWVCHLDKDIEGVFDPEQNSYFKHGDAVRWILKDDDSNIIGRIAAFYDRKTRDENDQPTGGCGFFECINNQDAANLLFDTAKSWLEKLGIEAMDGPINFGETDKFWGLLVDGFTQPAYKIAYNFPYYQVLFENYGFKIYYKQEGFHLDVKAGVPERYHKIAERVLKNPSYSFEHFKFSKIDKHVSDFTSVFNQAWADFKKDFEPLETSYVYKFLSDAKVVLEEEFIWFAFHEGEPIGIYLMYPDVNQIFKPFKGSLSLWNKLRLLYMVKTGKMTRARGVLMGLTPKYQGKGIEVGFIHHIENALKRKPQYTELEFSWVGDFNPRMRKIWMTIGAKSVKHYITYRYMFDRNAPYKRYPIPE